MCKRMKDVCGNSTYIYPSNNGDNLRNLTKISAVNVKLNLKKCYKQTTSNPTLLLCAKELKLTIPWDLWFKLWVTSNKNYLTVLSCLAPNRLHLRDAPNLLIKKEDWSTSLCIMLWNFMSRRFSLQSFYSLQSTLKYIAISWFLRTSSKY